METIKIGGREIPLLLTSYELIAIQKEIGCTVGQLREEVFGITEDIETGEAKIEIMQDPEMLRKFGTLIRILGNAGLEENGEEPDLEDKWVLRRLKPGLVLIYAVAVMGVINDAMSMEAAAEEPKGPVDVLLEEENRKKEPRS